MHDEDLHNGSIDEARDRVRQRNNDLVEDLMRCKSRKTLKARSMRL